MQCYTELLPPTGVTHSLALPFISESANNLVVARTSRLQIFSLLNIGPRPGSTEEQGVPKLILEREYALPGTVTDLCRVKLLNTKSGGEAILLAFRNAKLSLIEWDPGRYGICTISIHYYERDDSTSSPWVPDLSSCGSILSVDPSSRCAVFNFGIRNLAILPFHQPGDDLVMDDYGELNEERLGSHGLENGNDCEMTKESTAHGTHTSSFVLPLAALDPSILHPISLAFLYEYREPTFGILYSQVATSNALLHERKDVVFYTVFTLDLEQRASTTLLSVSRLPSDLFKVVALPPPVGGALLIGSNELVHVDQAGKTNAVGVNEFSRQVSSFSMTDQSDLALRLEGCIVERLSETNGDLLLVPITGDIVLVKFKLDGRSVSGISVHPVPSHAGGDIVKSAASSSAFLGDNMVFLGSEDADSILLGWSIPYSGTKKPRSQARRMEEDSGEFSDEEQSEDDVYEDDLYATVPEVAVDGRRPSAESSGSILYNFREYDRLLNIGPLKDIAFGKSFTSFGGEENAGNDSDLELVASHGWDRSGGLAVMKRGLELQVLNSMRIDSASCVWAASVAHMEEAVSKTTTQVGKRECHQYVVVSKATSADREQSEVFRVEGQELRPFRAPEFNPNEDVTVDIGTLTSKNRVVQILRSEVRSYDGDLGLAQIYPVWDEDTSEERMAISSSLVDPYVAILRDDSTLLLLHADDSGDLDEVELNEQLATSKWTSCCLYFDKTGIFSSLSATSEKLTPKSMTLFLMTQDCRLFIYRLPDQKLLTTIEGVDCLPPVLSSEPPKRSTTREALAEVVVTDLGDTWSSFPYLIIRSRHDDLAVYRPFIPTTKSVREPHADLNFLKETNSVLPRIASGVEDQSTSEEVIKSVPLRIVSNVSGFSAIFRPGISPGFIVRTSTSSPHFLCLKGGYAQSLSKFETSECGEGFILLDSKGVVHVCRVPLDVQLDYSWTIQQIPIGEQVDRLAYSSSSGMYVLGTSHRTEFKLPEDDELHPEWRNEMTSFFPEVQRSSLKVVSPKTWTVVDSYLLSPAEHVMAVKNMSLEISENTHERKDMIVVGTAFARGEDIASRGCVYVFEVIKVVPDPERPETDRKLRLVGKEPVKGAVTALSEIGGQGFLIVAQGQKCIVRGLKEDGSLLPVAFMDVQCHVSVVKELKGTGMCIIADAVKGLWFAGYSEEPYKMSLFAKDLDYLEVLAADFLPDGNKLFILVADSDCNLYVLQYDPEDPKSSNGDRLLSRSKFHTGNFISTLTLLPRTSVSSEQMISDVDAMDVDIKIPRHQMLITSQNGSVGLVTCVSEESYRRLSALQSQLTNTIEHPCGLNPRAFRAVESDGTAGRGMLDGKLLFQWLDMSKQRKVEIASRVGANEWEIKADFETISGEGLGYL
ncbi:CPSF A subunit region-domain-containing protein [Aspergillus pseudocaelatus]|uniref:CPSF A subunit region-domain-containing protein n=1 Tax=Aspergillus pseudocaelatus TaxID=1825620 RepID=A0ABQ6W461_9EURO|nr:CPSF A subunit region-domain-containing protein [Aspergillus pseudocaelatus]